MRPMLGVENGLHFVDGEGLGTTGPRLNAACVLIWSCGLIAFKPILIAYRHGLRASELLR
jgi:hypothetical protein